MVTVHMFMWLIIEGTQKLWSVDQEIIITKMPKYVCSVAKDITRVKKCKPLFFSLSKKME